uniref:Uncharacterized protein n=1 Tax=Oryza barthii TaxID=65489 RepID=A0A0D3HAR1_9ORYZ
MLNFKATINLTAKEADGLHNLGFTQTTDGVVKWRSGGDGRGCHLQLQCLLLGRTGESPVEEWMAAAAATTMRRTDA